MQPLLVSTVQIAATLSPTRRPRHRVTTITGIRDHLRPEWLITITGIRTLAVRVRLQDHRKRSLTPTLHPVRTV